jgi:hypothetical protein
MEKMKTMSTKKRGRHNNILLVTDGGRGCKQCLPRRGEDIITYY